MYYRALFELLVVQVIFHKDMYIENVIKAHVLATFHNYFICICSYVRSYLVISY